MQKRSAMIKFITSLVIFGLNGVVASRTGISNYDIVFWRTFIGFICLTAIFFAKGFRPSFHKKQKSLVFLTISGVSMGISWMLLFGSYTKNGISITSMLYYTGPIWVLMLSPAIFKEKLSIFSVIGFVIVLLGMVLTNIEGATSGTLNPSLLLAIGSALTFALMVISNKKASEIVGLENTILQIFFAFLSVSAYILISGRSLEHITMSGLPYVLFLGFISTGLACYLYFSAIQELNASTVSICGYIDPMSALLFAGFLCGEKLSPLQYLGAVLIFGGACIGELFSKKA